MMKILVRGTNWIGDAVMTIPAMRRLRASFPDARIALLTRSWAEGIFRDADFVDEIIGFDRGGSKVADAFAQSKTIRDAGFDVALLFTNSFESALVAKMAGIPRRVGFAKEGRSFLLTDALPVPEWKNLRHESFYYLELVAGAERLIKGSAEPIGDEFESGLAVSGERRSAARSLLAGIGAGRRPVVALGAGSTNSEAKRWPADRFAALASMLVRKAGASVVLVGSRDESGVAGAVAGGAGVPVADLTGRTSLAEAVAILAEADLMISNDMGLAHVSAATGTPTLVIFGPTNELTTRPAGSRIIRREVDCAPCMLRTCPIDHRCMTGIEPEAVFEAAAEMLGDKLK